MREALFFASLQQCIQDVRLDRNPQCGEMAQATITPLACLVRLALGFRWFHRAWSFLEAVLDSPRWGGPPVALRAGFHSVVRSLRPSTHPDRSGAAPVLPECAR